MAMGRLYSLKPTRKSSRNWFVMVIRSSAANWNCASIESSICLAVSGVEPDNAEMGAMCIPEEGGWGKRSGGE